MKTTVVILLLHTTVVPLYFKLILTKGEAAQLDHATTVAKAYLSLGALFVGGVHEDAPVGDGAVNVGDHGANVASSERGAAILRDTKTTSAILLPLELNELMWSGTRHRIIQLCDSGFSDTCKDFVFPGSARLTGQECGLCVVLSSGP